MTGIGWAILAGCVIFNLVSTYFFFTEDRIEVSSEESEDVKKIIQRNKKIYATVCLVVNIVIVLLINMYYGQTSIVIAWKRISLLSILWPVGYIDWKTCTIPNRYILLGLVYRLCILVFEVFMESNELVNNLISEGISVLVLLIASFLCSICIKNSIGFGDIKLFIVMGLALGLNSIWSAIFISLLLTFFVSLFLLITKKKSRKDSIPFAPLLMVGTYVSIILTGM